MYVNSGSIKIGGVDVRDIPKDELMNTVSFVFQNSKLIKASILDNVKMGKSNAADEEVLNALRAAQCMDIIEKFPDGVNTVIGSRGVYLSGGEMQRIAIARAVLKNAPIIILDEATAFADPDNEVKVQTAFAKLSEGKTVIMIAHRLSTVRNADCIYVISDGKVAEYGNRAELIEKKGMFYKNAKMTINHPLAGKYQTKRRNREMIKLIQKATASSKDGAAGLIKGIIACAFQNMAFMLPTGLLYYLVKDLLGGDMGGKAVFYTVGCVICFALILITTWFQYNNTFLRHTRKAENVD